MSISQQVIIMEGHDRAGKSTIGQELARQLGVPYFKNPQEKETFSRDPNSFDLLTRYAGINLMEFLKQTKTSVILDRHYPSEWVYSAVYGRTRDEALFTQLDRGFARMHTHIIICHKHDLTGYNDELVPPERVPELVEQYYAFSNWTKCANLLFDTTGADLDHQIRCMLRWLHQS